MRVLTVVLTFVALGMSSATMAQGYAGWYLGARGGATWLDEHSFRYVNVPTLQSHEFEAGHTIGGHVGYDFGAFRLEGEVSYRDNEVDAIRLNSLTFPGVSSHGSMDSVAFMANAYYDIELGSPFAPYVGAGLGVARVFANDITRRASFLTDFVVSDHSTRLAYQAIAGATWWFTPALGLTLDYRYFVVDEPNFPLSPDPGLGRVQLDYTTHNVMVGLTWRFPKPAPMAPMPGAAPPPPPPPAVAPPPPPAAPKTYLVFFDFDKADITPEAANIIRQAAVDARTQSVRLIVATGHADRSGPTGYNQRLSERRAAAVKSALVREGVAAGIIQTVGRGENENLVATADGVREPRNRRVEIVFR